MLYIFKHRHQIDSSMYIIQTSASAVMGWPTTGITSNDGAALIGKARNKRIFEFGFGVLVEGFGYRVSFSTDKRVPAILCVLCASALPPPPPFPYGCHRLSPRFLQLRRLCSRRRTVSLCFSVVFVNGCGKKSLD